MKRFIFIILILLLINSIIVAGEKRKVSYSLSAYLNETLKKSIEYQTYKKELESYRALKSYYKDYYIPYFKTTPYFSYDLSPSSRTYEVVDELEDTVYNYDFTLSQNTPLGSSISFDFDNSYTTTNNASATWNPMHNNSISLTLSQPLLKGFANNYSIKNIKDSEVDYYISQKNYEKNLVNLYISLINAYWDFYVASEELLIKEASYKRALDQFEFTKINIEKGLLPANDIYVVEESLISFQNNLEIAKNDFENKKYNFSKFLELRIEDNESIEIIGLEKPSDKIILSQSYSLLKEKLYENHYDYIIQELNVRKAEITYKYNKNQVFPQLDLSLSLALSGISDTFEESMNQVMGANSYYGLVGLTFRLPFYYGFLKSNIIYARSALEQEKFELKKIERDMLVDLSKAYNQVVLSQKQYKLKIRIATLAKLKLQAEEEKYREGISTLNDLVIFQRELDEAQNSLISALVYWNKYYNNLLYMVGGIKDLYEIE
ncbi:MAG: TolC family protein [Pseudomonadota bacterium]